MIALSPTLFIAFLGGVLPALLWLTFWLFEDRCEPEPKRFIFMSFVVGMIAVAPVLFIEKTYAEQFDPTIAFGMAAQPLTLLVWAFSEEIFKFVAAYITGLRSWVFDEPLDALMYMVTAALGFSAAENTLFLLGMYQQLGLQNMILTGDLRFIGASLLHTLSSGIIGVAIAFSFYKTRQMRIVYAVVGVILATALHTMFNFFILKPGGNATFWVFLCIWFGIIALLALTERIKYPARDYC